MTNYQPGTYVKGDSVRAVDSPAGAVNAVWDGYVLQSVSAEDVAYRDLQQQAKELGIPANQSAKALEASINAELSKVAPTPSDDDDEPDEG